MWEAGAAWELAMLSDYPALWKGRFHSHSLWHFYEVPLKAL